jgi:hypothetical protein
MISAIKIVDREDKALVAALAASVSVYFFMTTNVRMFAPQVNFLLWINIAVVWAVYKNHVAKRLRRSPKY